MAFPVVEARATTDGATNTSHTINLPSGIATGDLLIVVFGLDFTSATVTWPSGWTQIAEGTGDGSNRSRGFVGYRVADGGEGYTGTGDTISITTSASDESAAVSLRISAHGHDNSTPPDIANSNGGSGDAVDPPNLAPAGGAADYLWIATRTSRNGNYVTSYPTNYAEGTENSNTGAVSAATCERQLNASSEDPGVFTIDVGRPWSAFTIAVSPDTGGGGATLDLNAGSYTVTGQSATLAVARNLSLDTGAYTVTGQDATLSAGRTFSLDAGSYSVTGSNATLTAARQLALDSGNYTVTGQDVALAVARQLTFDAGSYIVTGQDVTLTYTPASGAFELALDAGSYVITGHDVGLTVARALTLDSAAYTVTGQDAQLLVGRILAAESGAYTVIGHDANLAIARALTLATGSYAVTGQSVTFLYSGNVTPTDVDRVYVISAEDRVYVIALDNRTFSVANENRTVTIQ